jgi:hypothetical protein
MIDEQAVLEVLKVAHATSVRGEGLALHDALRRAQYRTLRHVVGPHELFTVLQRYPDLASDWASFSEDKRTSGGWYISGSEIGQVGAPNSRVDFPSALEAVAEYVVRELDFWVGVSGEGDCKQNGIVSDV